MTKSEKKILAVIKSQLHRNHKLYDFWFVYNDTKAVNWEGGFELGQKHHFRNQYTVKENKQVKKNWG